MTIFSGICFLASETTSGRSARHMVQGVQQEGVSPPQPLLSAGLSLLPELTHFFC